MQKLSDQITVRLAPELRAAILEIEGRHRIGAAEFVRGLVEAGVSLYREQGYFSFPIEVIADKRRTSPAQRHAERPQREQLVSGGRP